MVASDESISATVDISSEEDARGAAAEGRGAVAVMQLLDRGPEELERLVPLPLLHGDPSGVAAVISTERRCMHRVR